LRLELRFAADRIRERRSPGSETGGYAWGGRAYAERAEHELKEWIAAAEMALVGGDDDTPAERFSWLATGLLRRSQDKLWALLREARTEELEKIPDVDALLDALGQKLVSAGRLEEAEDLMKASRRWEIRLTSSIYRQLAQAQAQSGATTRAEETV
jgi:predicted Zn-dependent protease